MSVKQISVFLENKPGSLKKLTGVLAEHKIDMRAISMVETRDFGIARIVVDDPFTAANILKEEDFISKLNSVLVVEIPDETGGLDKLINIFTEAEVNIEYMYAVSAHRTTKKACMIFRVADTKAAEARLLAKGLKILTQDEVMDI
jgi:hypothetical protein